MRLHLLGPLWQDHMPVAIGMRSARSGPFKQVLDCSAICELHGARLAEYQEAMEAYIKQTGRVESQPVVPGGSPLMVVGAALSLSPLPHFWAYGELPREGWLPYDPQAQAFITSWTQGAECSTVWAPAR